MKLRHTVSCLAMYLGMLKNALCGSECEEKKCILWNIKFLHVSEECVSLLMFYCFVCLV